MEKCSTCYYCDKLHGICDYILITGKRRGCPVDDCKRYLPAKENTSDIKRKTAHHQYFTDTIMRNRAIEECYYQGLADEEIAFRIGHDQKIVLRWRRNNHMPPNHRKKEGE